MEIPAHSHQEGQGDGEVESIRAFGRRVERSHPTILQAIEEKRITAVKRHPQTGRLQGVYWRQALAEYARNTDPTQAERTGAAPLPPQREATGPNVPLAGNNHADGQTLQLPDLGKPAIPAGDDLFDRSDKSGKDDHGYLEHRARTEEFRSKAAELEYLKDLGLLISATEAREANFLRYRTLRDKLLNVPDRVATILAAERDAGRVHQQLTAEIKRVLSELSIDATATAAAGVAERVAP